jgi:hypothetical protein
VAITTRKLVVSFDGSHLQERPRSTKRSRSDIWSVPARAISSIEFGEYTWLTRPGWDRDANYYLKVTYGQPVEQWNGATLVPTAQGRQWNFPKSEGDSVRSLHQALLRATG